MRTAVRWLVLAAGVLMLVGWTLPYTLLFGRFSRLAFVPPGHGSYLPWIGALAGLLGLALVAKGATGRFGPVLPAAASTVLLIIGVIHTHQIWLHAAPTVWSWVDAAWPLIVGGALKLAQRKG